MRVFENRVVRKIFLDEGGRYRRMEKITSGGASCFELLTRCFELLTRYYTDDHIKGAEMGQACDIYGREVKYFHTGFWWGSLKERDRLKNLDVDGEGNIKVDSKERV